MKLFHSLDTTDWTRVSIIVASVTATWIGLQEIVPERYHHKGTVILAALSSGITLMMKSGKSREEKVVEKVKEIDTLVKSEAQDQIEKGKT